MSRMVEFEGCQGLAPMNWTPVRVVFDVDQPLVIQEDPGDKKRSLLAIGGWIYTVGMDLDRLQQQIENARSPAGQVQFTNLKGPQVRGAEPKGFRKL